MMAVAASGQDYSHWTDKETEAQREADTCPRSECGWTVKLGLFPTT